MRMSPKCQSQPRCEYSMHSFMRKICVNFFCSNLFVVNVFRFTFKVYLLGSYYDSDDAGDAEDVIPIEIIALLLLLDVDLSM